jgi:magnesium and cobalt exporter, CNNM family
MPPIFQVHDFSHPQHDDAFTPLSRKILYSPFSRAGGRIVAMRPEGYLFIMGGLACAGVSFFFALTESALFALGQWRARRLIEARNGSRVLRLLEKPSDLLSTIVLGNTVANGCLVALALWRVVEGRWQLLPTMIGLFLFILLGCEVLPKTLAVRAPERWALRVARPILAIQLATRSIQTLAQTSNGFLLRLLIPKSIKPQRAATEEDYQELLEMAHQQGALAKSEKEIILEILDLDRKTAKDVMKPRSYMAVISDDLSVEEMIRAARKYKHRRLPLFDESPDTIVGILNTRALLLHPDQDLWEAVEFPSFVPETMNLLHLLKSLQRQQRGLAVVLDEFGGTAGLVTLEDILEEVVGEIRSDGEPADAIMEHVGEGRWRVKGTMRLDDLGEDCPQLENVPDVDTVGGLLMAKLEVVPKKGQFIVFRGLRLTALEADERRVHLVLVERMKRK